MIYKGAGLGLSIVKQLIDEIAGEIYIESHAHQGTQFICLFPLKESLLEIPQGEETLDGRELSSIFCSVEKI